MALNATQLATLATDLAANTNTVLIAGQSTQIRNVAHDRGDNAAAVAAWYNLLTSTAFYGNYASVPLAAIKAQVTFKNYTPTDAPPASGSTTQITNDLLLYVARALVA